MKRLLFVIAALCLTSASAFAACVSPMTGNDAGGTSRTFGVTLDAATNCYGNVAIVDGSNAANKVTVTAGNALKVDGSAVTQPVSGNITTVTTVSTVSASRTVGNAGGVLDAIGQNVTAPANWLQTGCQFNTTPTTISSGSGSPIQCTNAGLLLTSAIINGTVTVNGSGTTQPTSVAAGQIVNGADVALGATTDAACAGGGSTCTLEARTAHLENLIASSIPAGTNLIGNVGSATGSAPPSAAVYLGGNASGATGGQLKGLITCDSHAKFDATTTGYVTLVPGVASRKIYVCGYILGTGGTATNLDLSEDTVTNCTNAPATLTPVWQLLANDKIGTQAAFWTGLITSTNGNYICIHASAGNSHQAEIWYTIL
jgi:hypothetical protein